eukprot:scaffold161729_cov60-Attheya_sp.AAC.3
MQNIGFGNCRYVSTGLRAHNNFIRTPRAIGYSYSAPGSIEKHAFLKLSTFKLTSCGTSTPACQCAPRTFPSLTMSQDR